MDGEGLDVMSLIKEEMQTEEIHLKVNAIHRLKIVALTLGPQETETVLLPYIDSKTLNKDAQPHFSFRVNWTRR